MNLERLNETLAKHDDEHTLGSPWYHPSWVDDLADAARAYRDLANGERVKWCEEHKASADEDTCWSGAVFSDSTPCHIVSKLLVDPLTEED